MPNRYLVIYDIAKNRERHRVSKVLERYGLRVQKSAFETDLDRVRKSRLIEDLQRLSIQTGIVYLYRVETLSSRIEVGGLRPAAPTSRTMDATHGFIA